MINGYFVLRGWRNSADMLQKDAALSILGYIYFKEDSAASAARILAEHVLPIARDQTADTLLRARVPFPFACICLPCKRAARLSQIILMIIFSNC